MLYYIYDNTFEGLLTAVFDAFERKEIPDRIAGQESVASLFIEMHEVTTDNEKAQRVFAGLTKKLSQSAVTMLSTSFLSEFKDIEIRIFHYIKKSLLSPISIELNFADDDVLYLAQVYKKVHHEATHMKQFVRFQKTADGMFFAVMDPKYNVLPLCSDFFADRYADQPWVIYDTRRNYGLYYNLQTTEIVHFDKLPVSLLTGKLDSSQQDNEEKDFQELWNDYLNSINIKERKNLKLQRQHMPKRFWKYLTEKNR